MVTNIDADHMDFYPNLDAIKETFLKFMNMVPFYGVNVVCGDDENIMELIPLVKRSIITYGFKEHNTIRGEIIETGAKSKFKVFMDGEFWGECIIGIPGIHNILNGMGVIGVANHFGISKEHIIRALEGFKGVGRRLEKVGEIGGVLVVDDYGHHPTEIKTTLKTIKDVYPDKRLVVAFQPHRYTRTKALFGDFCKSFGLADVLLVTEIYPASEDPIPGVDGESLAKGIKQLSNTNVIYCEDLTSCLLKVKEVLNPGDLLLTLGAGNIWKVGVSYVHEREEI